MICYIIWNSQFRTFFHETFTYFANKHLFRIIYFAAKIIAWSKSGEQLFQIYRSSRCRCRCRWCRCRHKLSIILNSPAAHLNVLLVEKMIFFSSVKTTSKSFVVKPFCKLLSNLNIYYNKKWKERIYDPIFINFLILETKLTYHNSC